MKKLVDFCARHKHWFLFIVMEIVALTILFNQSLYHRSLGLIATNKVVGTINSGLSKFDHYLHLSEENRDLISQLATAEQRYLVLERKMQAAIADTVHPLVFANDSILPTPNDVSFITARVINASSNRINNYLSIDKGLKDGIEKEMSVMSTTGVVGTVTDVSDHTALVVPIINSKLRLSCRLKNQGFVGSLVWDDPSNTQLAHLTDLPQHAIVKPGDTIVTSGYSDIYYPNLVVGYVTKEIKGNTQKQNSSKEINLASGTNLSSVPIMLATDFSRLSYVYVLTKKPNIRAKKLQDSISNNGL
ncbi:rod shape-determining protein MreC [Falsiporphyromonas endometrii]|uniref:Cell shape-determining protein MreC n=1 Tax=Falsiporphyromonas endometrii TaxID=1387297 RepID=A0ABV9K9A8_9PORP